MPANRVQILIFIISAALLSYCKSPIRAAKKHIIGLQPIGSYDKAQLQFIQNELQSFFKTPVVILNEMTMPAAFMNTSKGERYSADSLIKWLARTAPDSVFKVVGLTHKDIFTTKYADGAIKKPENTYAVWGIFGMGFKPGKSSVVSDHRLHTNDPKQFKHRFRTVVIHELGHNQGLDHCTTANCIMSDANESIKTVDNSSNSYCKKCNNQLSD